MVNYTVGYDGHLVPAEDEDDDGGFQPQMMVHAGPDIENVPVHPNRLAGLSSSSAYHRPHRPDAMLLRQTFPHHENILHTNQGPQQQQVDALQMQSSPEASSGDHEAVIYMNNDIPPSAVHDNNNNNNNNNRDDDMSTTNEDHLNPAQSLQPETDDGPLPLHQLSQAGPSSAPPFYVGMPLDVLDTVQKWCEAEVVEVDAKSKTIRITYTYWGDQFDETLPWDTNRLAVAGSRTFNGDPETLQVGSHAW